jgi:DNA-binding SARP family transcriptional activator/DNA-binding CsgD family transcriptional regulator
MEFRILGSVEALDEGRLLPLGGGKQRALLAVLLLHANETLSTDRLVDELWGERPPATPAKAVQVHVSRLRKALANGAGNGSAGLVVTREHGYELRLDPERIDARRFERLCSVGRSELAAGRPSGAVSVLQEALSLWRGRPLADLAYEPFAQREIARLEELRIDARELLIEAKLALGRDAELVGQLETLIGEHPYRERLRGQLMLALYRCDRQAEALQAYQDARTTLVEELGIEPGGRLRELERAILAQDPALATPAPPPVAAAPREPVEALLERDGPLAAIDELIESGVRGEGSVVAVEAAAGLGKSALLALARERAAARRLTVASARGADLERDFPFGIVRQLLEPLVAREADDEGRDPFEGAAALASPLFRAPQAPVSSEPSAIGPAESSGAAMHGLYWLAVNLTQRGPLLLCVDDAHWGDTASLRWLNYLARRLEGLPLAVLVASRPGEAGSDTEALAAIAAEPITRLVPLQPLSEKASALFVGRALGLPADEQFCTACHAVSGGNPFLLGELTGTLAREGVEPTEASVSLLREFVPESVTRSLALRLGRLPDAARALARAVAVLGSASTLHEAAALAELERPEAARAAAALAAVAILAPRLPLDFVHPLVCTAVYGEQPAVERAVWHGRAARLLDARGAPSERIAAQLLRTEPAGDHWVVARLRDAAAYAMSRADPRSAVVFLRRALAEPASADERGAIAAELSEASFFAGDASGIDESRVAEIAADAEALRASAVYLVTGLWVTGRASEALALHERAVSAATADGDLDLALRLEIRWIMMGQLPPADALRRLERYIARVEPDSFAGRLLNATQAWCSSLTGRPATEVAERLRRAFSGGDLVTRLRDDPPIIGSYVFALLRTDELECGEQIIERILREGRARGSAPAVENGLFLSAYVSHLRGELARAEGSARAAAATLDTPSPLPLVPALLVHVLTDRGELDAAEHEMELAGMDGPVPDHWWFGATLWSRGYLRLAQGRAADGVEDLLELGRRWDRDGLGALTTWPWASHAAPFLAQLGRHDDAQRLAQRGLRDARAWGSPRVIGQAQRGLGLVTGGSAGLDALRESVRTLEASPARLEQARSLVDLGAALRQRGARPAAGAALRGGLDLAHRCGARPLEARAAHELRAAGAKPPKPVQSPVDRLTASQRRIAEMATQGLSDREIAEALFVTTKTVETHLASVFQKLNVGSRQELEPVISRPVRSA